MYVDTFYYDVLLFIRFSNLTTEKTNKTNWDKKMGLKLELANVKKAAESLKEVKKQLHPPRAVIGPACFTPLVL